MQDDLLVHRGEMTANLVLHNHTLSAHCAQGRLDPTKMDQTSRLEIQLAQYRLQLDSLEKERNELSVKGDGMARQNKKLRKQVSQNKKLQQQIKQSERAVELLDQEICEMHCDCIVWESKLSEVKPKRSSRRRAKQKPKPVKPAFYV